MVMLGGFVTHIRQFVCLLVNALLQGVCVCVSVLVCVVAVFDFKEQKMKPKTWEKLTKHTNPRWLMGQEK